MATIAIRHPHPLDALLLRLMDRDTIHAAYPVAPGALAWLIEQHRSSMPKPLLQSPDACAVGDALGYICTRAPGHDGPHVAHITTGRAVQAWPREIIA